MNVSLLTSRKTERIPALFQMVWQLILIKICMLPLGVVRKSLKLIPSKFEHQILSTSYRYCVYQRTKARNLFADKEKSFQKFSSRSNKLLQWYLQEKIWTLCMLQRQVLTETANSHRYLDNCLKLQVLVPKVMGATRLNCD